MFNDGVEGVRMPTLRWKAGGWERQGRSRTRCADKYRRVSHACRKVLWADITLLWRAVQSLQVRQPLYTRAVGRWRRYEAQLAPLAAAVRQEVEWYERAVAAALASAAERETALRREREREGQQGQVEEEEGRGQGTAEGGTVEAGDSAGVTTAGAGDKPARPRGDAVLNRKGSSNGQGQSGGAFGRDEL